nr:hypothetical protein Itr_chr02CG18840 [Ipomoea trifida]
MQNQKPQIQISICSPISTSTTSKLKQHYIRHPQISICSANPVLPPASIRQLPAHPPFPVTKAFAAARHSLPSRRGRQRFPSSGRVQPPPAAVGLLSGFYDSNDCRRQNATPLLQQFR